MTGLARLAVLVAAVVVVFVVGGSAVLAKVPDLREKAGDLVRSGGRGETGQGAAQLSTAEFAHIRPGITPSRLRGLVGEPESKNKTRVEGMEIECWYYGIVAETGSFQFCFANGKLTSRFRYAVAPRRLS